MPTRPHTDEAAPGRATILDRILDWKQSYDNRLFSFSNVMKVSIPARKIRSTRAERYWRSKRSARSAMKMNYRKN